MMRAVRGGLVALALGALVLLALPAAQAQAAELPTVASAGSGPAAVERTVAQQDPSNDPGPDGTDGPQLPLPGSGSGHGLSQRTVVGLIGIVLVVSILFGRRLRNKRRNKS